MDKLLRYSFWRKLLVEPKSQGSDRRRREFILNVLLVSSIAVATLAFITVIMRSIALGSSYNGEPPVFAAIQVGVFVGLWILSRKGFFIPAAYALVFIFFLLAFFILFEWGILTPQGVLLLVLVLIMSSILLGTRVSAISTIIASVTLILLSILQQSGKLAFDPTWMKTPGGPTDAIGFSLTLVVITTVSWLSNREIFRFNTVLQEQVRKATEHLRNANKNLKALDHTKDEFISMASHQLGTPLTAITGYLSMALDYDKHNMTPDQRQYIEYALEASERMGALSADLLNVSRLTAGRFVIRREPAHLTDIVRQEATQLAPAAKRKGLTMELAIKDVPVINIDSSKTRQVIMNFIDNAIYYTEHGKVIIELAAIKGAIVFTVTDTGIGVPDSEKSKLFTKFYRAQNAKDARPDGTGLGLYLAARIISDQGGSIIFESTLGQGSTFGFRMPLRH